MENTDCRSYRKNFGRFLNGKLEGKEASAGTVTINGGTFDINSDFERMLVDVQKEIKQESRRTMFFRTAMVVFLGVAYYFIGIGIVGY